jgi:PAT family beta-lactamase induction signal transducer AmpG
MKSDNRYLTKNPFSRTLTFSALYVAQGIPEGITYFAIPAWLAINGKTPMEIASFVAVIGIPWAFKILIAPLMDRYTILSMGRKRPWVILGQLGLIVSFLSFVFIIDPLNNLQSLKIAGFFISFFGAFQDVATDGMAVDVIPIDEQAKTNGFMWGSKTIGIALSLVIGTALINSIGFNAAIASLSIATASIMLFPLLFTERHGEKMLPWSKGEASDYSTNAQVENWGTIFKNIWKATRLPSTLLMLIASLFMGIMFGLIDTSLPIFTIQKLNWNNSRYSEIFSIATVIAGFLALFFAGELYKKLGDKKIINSYLFSVSILIFGFGSFHHFWKNEWIVIGFIFMYYLTYTFLLISVFAACMKLCWKTVAATQFTLFMAVSNVGRAYGSGLVGTLKENMDWNYVFMCIALFPLISIPFIKMLNFNNHSVTVNSFG